MYRIIKRNGRFIPQVRISLLWYGIEEKGLFRKSYDTWYLYHAKYCSYSSQEKAKKVIEGYKESLIDTVVWEEDINLTPYTKEGRAGPRPGY